MCGRHRNTSRTFRVSSNIDSETWCQFPENRSRVHTGSPDLRFHRDSSLSSQVRAQSVGRCMFGLERVSSHRTGSFGSVLACLCGLVAIFYVQSRKVNITRAILAVAAIGCTLFLTYAFSPTSVKGYLGKHYESRVSEGTGQDRFALWGRAVQQLFEHPEGVGWTLAVGIQERHTFITITSAYEVSYGLVGGLAYTVLIAGLLISFFRSQSNAFEDPAALAVYLAGLGVIVAIAVNSMTDHMTENRWYFNLIWSIIWYSHFCSRAVQTKVSLGGPRTKKEFGETRQSSKVEAG